MPRFSNLDPGDRGQHQLQRQRIRAAQQQQQQQQAAAAGGYNQHAAAQLRRNASLDEDRGLSGLGIGGGEFAGTTKYTALFRASQQQKEVVPAVGTNAGLVNGSASAAIPVYAASVKAADTGGGGYNPSFGGGTSTTRLHQSHQQHQHQHPSHHTHHHQHHPNSIVANGLLHNSNVKDNSGSSGRSVTFSTNAALAATSPLYAGRHQQQLQQPPPPSLSQQTNKFFSPFRSLPGEDHPVRMLVWLQRFPQKCLVLIPLIRWPRLHFPAPN